MEKGEGRGEGGKVCCLITKLIVLLFSDGEGHMEKSPSLSEVRRIGGVHLYFISSPFLPLSLTILLSSSHAHRMRVKGGAVTLAMQILTNQKAVLVMKPWRHRMEN